MIETVEFGSLIHAVLGALGIGFIVGFVAGAYAFIKNEEMLKRRYNQNRKK